MDMEEILQIRSCVEILTNDVKIYTSAVNKELQGIHTGGCSFSRLKRAVICSAVL